MRRAQTCVVHGGNLPVVKREASEVVADARTRLLGLSDSAVDVVEQLLQSKDEDIRLKTTRDMLDRVIPRLSTAAHLVVDTTADRDPGEAKRSAAEIVRERLDELRGRHEQATVFRAPSWAATDGAVIDINAYVVDSGTEPKEVDDDATA